MTVFGIATMNFGPHTHVFPVTTLGVTLRFDQCNGFPESPLPHTLRRENFALPCEPGFDSPRHVEQLVERNYFAILGYHSLRRFRCACTAQRQTQ